MKDYKSVENLSLRDCYEFLTSEENRKNPLYPLIAERYEEVLRDLFNQDNSDFAASNTIDSYHAYIKKFSDNSIAPYYKAKHIDEAKNAIEDLFWNAHKKSVGGCKEYLSRYPKGKYANIANGRIGSSKKSKWLALGIVLIVLVIAFFIGYKPVNSLSVSEISLSFGKWGGTENVHISTNVSSNAVDVRCSGAGFDTEKDYGFDFKVSAGANEGDSRIGTVKVTAYATLYGMRMGEGKSVTTNLSQESGLATYLRISPTSINTGKFGDTYQVSVQTDGVKKIISSPEDWISVSDDNNGTYGISIPKNSGDSRQGVIVFESGTFRKELTVSQASGLATYLSLSRSSINNVEKSGRCYKVNVSTDGVSWDVYSSPSWVNITKYDNFFEITVNYNSDEVRSGTIYVNSNNGHSESISISQDGNPSNFYASRSSLSFDTDRDYEYISVTNNSNQNVYVSTDKGWLSATMSGSSVKISCSSNSDSPRSGTVTLRCGNKRYSISVKQKGWVNCSSCGGRGYVTQIGYRQNFMGYTPMGQPMYGPPYPVQENVTCATCKNSGRKGKVKRSY